MKKYGGLKGGRRGSTFVPGRLGTGSHCLPGRGDAIIDPGEPEPLFRKDRSGRMSRKLCDMQHSKGSRPGGQKFIP